MKRLLMVCALATLLVPAAQAGKGSRTVGILETAPYVFGETIHPFTNVPSYADLGPYYSLFCYQPDPLTGGSMTVFGIAQYRVFPRDGSTVSFTLSGPQWTAGAADCDLTVWHVNAGLKNRTQDASMSFSVSG